MRDALATLDKTQPSAWTFYARSLLGGSLLGQKKYADAEPLLTQGYEGVKQRKNEIHVVRRKFILAGALERLVQLDEAIDKPDDAAKWRKELAELQPPAKQPAKQ